MKSRDGVRVTKVGLWFALFSVIVGIAATNTGNNALYMVLAAMLGLMFACWILTRINSTRLEMSVEVNGEVFARATAAVEIRLSNVGRFFARRQLLVQIEGLRPMVVDRLGRHGDKEALTIANRQVTFERRGRYPLGPAQIISLFPLGLFRSSKRPAMGRPVLVFPELLRQPRIRYRNPGELGDDSTRRGGWGHDLHALRPFRAGDDPRSVHWKQTARIGELIYKEREAEESRRLSLVLDNGVGELVDDQRRREFERLVSEAATASVDSLDRGFEVELITRQHHLPFAAGPRQRHDLLECLALLEPCAVGRRPLERNDSTAPELRLTLDLLRPRRPGPMVEIERQAVG